jgi:hypothetical protein
MSSYEQHIAEVDENNNKQQQQQQQRDGGSIPSNHNPCRYDRLHSFSSQLSRLTRITIQTTIQKETKTTTTYKQTMFTIKA